MQVAASVAGSGEKDASAEFLDIFGRLKQATSSATDTDLANCLGIQQGSVSVAKKRLQIPPAWITKISRDHGVSADWILYGTGPMHRGNAQIAPAEAQKINPIPEGEPQWMSAKDADDKGYSLVPKVRARLSAGTGSLETEGDVIGLYAFKTDFLRRKGHAKLMVLMDVAGDSMEPDIWSGDTVLIDQGQNEIIAGGLFAIGIDQEVYVKYLDKIPGKLVLRSRNERYTPIEVDMNGEISGSIRIIGRVVWSCREYVR